MLEEARENLVLVAENDDFWLKKIKSLIDINPTSPLLYKFFGIFKNFAIWLS